MTHGAFILTAKMRLLFRCASAPFLLSACQDRPADAGYSRDKANHVESLSREVARNSADFADPPASKPLNNFMRFDLECSYRGRVVADPRPRPRGSPDEGAWSGSLHYVVDLYAMRFCDPIWCERDGPKPIAAASTEAIYFYNDPFATPYKPSTVETVRLRDGRYTQRIADDEGHVRLTTGTCRHGPFSGFPDREG